MILWKVPGGATLYRVIMRGLYEKVLFQLGRKAFKEQMWHTHETRKKPMRLKHKDQGKGEGI